MDGAVQDKTVTVVTNAEHASKLVLLVEDDDAAAEELSEILELEGWHPLTARNVTGALAVIENTAVQLIITDVHLGNGGASGESGIHLVSRAQALFPDRDLSFIVLSGDVDAVKSSLQTDAVDFLLKPVASDDLIGAINEAKRWSGKERNLSEFADYLIQKTGREAKGQEPSIANMITGDFDKKRRLEATTEEKTFVLNYVLGSEFLQTAYRPVISFEGEGLIGVEPVPIWTDLADTNGDTQTFLDNARSTSWGKELDDRVRERALATIFDAASEEQKLTVAYRADQLVGTEGIPGLLRKLAENSTAPESLNVEVLYDASLETAVELVIKSHLAPFAEGILRIDGRDFASACGIAPKLAEFGFGWMRLSMEQRPNWHSSPDACAEVRAVLAVVRRVGVKLIVDGVDTPEALAWLNSEGCDAVQGDAAAGLISAENFHSFLTGKMDLEEATS